MTIQEMRERKIELGYTNEKLAELTKVPYSTIQKIFAGKTSAPRRSTILALEKALQREKTLQKTLQEEKNAGQARIEPDPAAEAVSTTAVSVEAGSTAAAPAGAGLTTAAAPAGAGSTAAVPTGAGGSVKPGTVYSAHRGLPDGMVVEQAPAYGTAKEVRKYTIYDYFHFPDDRPRCELIDGIIYDMTSPTLHHQWVLTQLGREFSNYIDEHNGDCRAFVAPLIHGTWYQGPLAKRRSHRTAKEGALAKRRSYRTPKAGALAERRSYRTPKAGALAKRRDYRHAEAGN